MQPMLMIMSVMMETKPTYSLKLKKLLKLDLDRHINPTMMNISTLSSPKIVVISITLNCNYLFGNVWTSHLGLFYLF
jgi:hypothetical protein